MARDVTEKVDALDDKHAIYVAQRLAQAVFKNQPQPSFDEIAKAYDNAAVAEGIDMNLLDRKGWNAIQLREGEAGALARAVLRSWAADPGLAPAIDEAIDRFKPSKQDFGVISIGVGIGLAYVLISMGVEIDLGFIKVRKAGLTGEQQATVVKETAVSITKAVSQVPTATTSPN